MWRSKQNGYDWLGEVSLADVCGAGGCMITSGGGVIEKLDDSGHVIDTRNYPFRQWDNHLTPIG